MSGDPGDSGAFDFDLYVIGGGSGGVRAARISAGHGARVGLAEEHRFGGTCVIRGCVPKKLMVYASAFSETFEDAEGFGWSVGDSAFDWSRFIAAKDKEIARLEGLYRKGLEGAGVAPHEGRAVVAGPHSVRLLGPDGAAREVTAKHILVAVGGRPFVPDFPGAEHAITSNDIFHLETQPRRILIAGGGYIACEFAGIMNGLGTETELIYRSGEILRGFDDDVRPLVRREMQKKGVKVRLNEIIDALEKGPDGLRVSFSGGDSGVYDQVLFATGRAPNTAGLGLESAGLALGASGEIPVDAYSQSAVPSIYAVGDVTNRVNLTPVAIREGHAFADTVFAARPTMVDHAQIPTAVFTQPEIGTVGLTEAEARAEAEAHGGVEIYRSEFRPMIHTLSGRDERMLMKIVVGQGDRRVLGAHIVGHGAAEMVQCLGIAVKMGATKEDFDRTVALHPSAAEELVTMRTPVQA